MTAESWRRTRIAVFALFASCGGEAESPVDEYRGHAADDHEDEPAHGAVPRRVRLTPQVVADAGIETAPVGRHAIARTVQLPGEIAADPDRHASVAARLEGVVESVAVQAGDAVEAGQVLAVVRAPDLQSLRAAAASLQARAASAAQNAERIGGLVERRMASAQEGVTARAEADALAAEARAARERLRALGVKRTRGGPVLFEVRAPITGVVTTREIVAGDPVTPQTVLATVVSLDEVWFVAHVFERDVARVHERSSAVVWLNAHPDEPFVGEVTSVSHQVDPDARTLSARIPLRNRDARLRLGLFGTAFVTTSEQPTSPRLAVPQSAVTRVLDEDVVFVRHDDGDFELHEVALGEADTENVAIVHGLREGEQVVVRGVLTLKSVLLKATIEDHGH